MAEVQPWQPYRAGRIASPIRAYGETPESHLGRPLLSMQEPLRQGLDRLALQAANALPRRRRPQCVGPAPYWTWRPRPPASGYGNLLRASRPRGPCITAYTISLGFTGGDGGGDSDGRAPGRCSKIKLGGRPGDGDRITAVRKGPPPESELIVDANRGMDARQSRTKSCGLRRSRRHAGREQPLPAGQDEALAADPQAA